MLLKIISQTGLALSGETLVERFPLPCRTWYSLPSRLRRWLFEIGPGETRERRLRDSELETAGMDVEFFAPHSPDIRQTTKATTFFGTLLTFRYIRSTVSKDCAFVASSQRWLGLNAPRSTVRTDDLSESFTGKDPILNEEPYEAQLLRAANAIGTCSGRDTRFHEP